VSSKVTEQKANVAGRLDELLDRKGAVRFLAERLPQSGDPPRLVRDRIGKLLDRAIEAKDLISRGDGCVELGALIAWAETKKTIRSHVAGVGVSGTAVGPIQMPAMELAGTMVSLPPTIESCHRALLELSAEVLQLRQENQRLLACKHELEKYETKAEERSRVAKENGRKGGHAKALRHF
jgi:hypothetical protein